MRFLKEEPSGVDKQVMIPVFKVNTEECRILIGVINNTLKYLPDITETQIVRSRLRNMVKTINNYLDDRPVPNKDGGFALQELLELDRKKVKRLKRKVKK